MPIKERAEKKKRRRLSWEILELVGAGALIALLAFVFLYFASMAISETYLTRRGFALDQRQLRILTVWIRSVCMAASARGVRGGFSVFDWAENLVSAVHHLGSGGASPKGTGF